MRIDSGLIKIIKISILNNNDLVELTKYLNSINIEYYSDLDENNDIYRVNLLVGNEELNIREGYNLFLMNNIPVMAEIKEFPEYSNIFKDFLTPQKP